MSDLIKHLTMEELEEGLGRIRQAPKNAGRLEAIVRRPAVDQREDLPQAELRLNDGLAGDTWITRPSSRTRICR